VQALIFDFDGLILDTEGPAYHTWSAIYGEHGHDLPLSLWASAIGTTGGFNPEEHLEQQLGRKLDAVALRKEYRRRCDEQIAKNPVLPGVRAYLEDAKRLGLKLGVASSSQRAWVSGHLARLGLLNFFQVVKGGDDVAKTKPSPDLYLAAMQALGVDHGRGIALEDSPNGVLAAKAAGLFCVAVPNALTRQLSITRADLTLESLADVPLAEVLRKAGQAR